MQSLTVIRFPVLLFFSAAVAIAGTTACDPEDPPIQVRNDWSYTVAIRVFDERGVHARVATKSEPQRRDTVKLKPGQVEFLLVGRVGESQYTFTVELLDGIELFQRTLTIKEIEKRKGHLVITGRGVE